MSKPIHDFIIIGGGPTGSSAATYLTRKGFKVLVLEREKFPRQHVGESLLPFCYPLFKELGVFDEMRRRFVRKPGVRFSNHNGTQANTWCFKNIIPDESYLSFHVVRADFDKMLLDNAQKDGAEVLEEAKVTNVILDNPDGIVDVTFMHHEQERKLQCRFVIDASGQDTFLGKRLGGKTAYKDLDRIAFLTHWKGAEYLQGIDVGLLQIVYLEEHKSGWFGLQPVGKDRVSVGLVIDRKYLKQEKEKFTKAGISEWQKALYLQEIENCALTKKILRDAKIAQPLIIVSDFSYYLDKTYGKNYAILGDAGKFLDPIFASGVYLGMNSSKMFADALEIYFRKDKAEGMKAMDDANEHINGAYSLVEKFINIFYDPKSFNLAEISSASESNYPNYETAFSLVHYLLAGDFFGRYKTYSEFLDLLSDPRKFAMWKNLVKMRPHLNELHCGTNFGEIFGDIDDELVRSTSINKVEA
jgi:flavin-dependent dehydrogenase